MWVFVMMACVLLPQGEVCTSEAANVMFPGEESCLLNGPANLRSLFEAAKITPEAQIRFVHVDCIDTGSAKG